ncbi:MAG: Fpg/Nei family DNA glycosylase [Candidatus Bipolaricaulota bacterium]|nr:Fpg/Nei family DNA glycosylase [Candidatus Bipolaricaulota bacterium]
MPELPEIVCRAREMDRCLAGRTIRMIEVLQPKCLNVPVGAFVKALSGAKIAAVSNRGKWLFVETSKGHLLLNLGMGGEILLVPQTKLPEKWRVRFDLDRGEALAVNFWWFGYAHYAAPGKLSEHAMSAGLGPNALDVSVDQFRALLAGRRGGIKSFLLDQTHVAGIGNAYIHDILFRAKLHPQRSISSLSSDEIERLHAAIQTELQRSIDVGGAFYEPGLDGKGGGFTAADLLVGYREGKPCPECGTRVEKIKTGTTATFVCPRCQPLRPASPPRKRPTRSKKT